MATIGTQAATVVGNYGYPGLQPELRVSKEAATATLKPGAFLNDTGAGFLQQHTDRKSTRLNSSHLVISYAVFCLKKKKKKKNNKRNSKREQRIAMDECVA